MRFESVTIEKYGLVGHRTLAFPREPGLVVIYGPNEAGKSTSLAAITDFLFGIPQTTPRGQVYGYDQIRLSATLVLADGSRLCLRRRKGRAGRTLTDENGEPVDEGLLARHLGATGRERFGALFGLDHMTLRSGGERLLAADGDIGRLIVEAGGGLRALVDMAGKLAADADALFATTRAGHRLFYKALDAFHAADRAAKEGLLTRDAYEEAWRRQKEAQAKVEEIRSQQGDLAETKSRLERLVRVIPAIRELDGVDNELAGFADLPPLREGFADTAQDALRALKQAETEFADAEERRAALAAKIGALTPSAAILAAETPIRDLEKKVVHVDKARGDRLNRQTELAERLAKLDVIRGALELGPDADLEAMCPPPLAIERVQKLAAQGLGRRAATSALEGQLANEGRTLADLAARQNERQKAGTSEPLGVTVAEFANLAGLSRTVEGAERKAERLCREITQHVSQLGFDDVERLAAWACPPAAMIQAELDRRAALDADIAKIDERSAAEVEKRDKAAGEIDHLLQAREIPTDASIARARKDREAAWQAICARYLSDKGVDVASRPLAERKVDIDQHRHQTEWADRLADQKSLEAERIATLDLAQRQKAEALAAIEILDQQRRALDERLRNCIRAWEEAWPEAVSRQSDLGRLKVLAEERATILGDNTRLREFMEDVEQHRAEMAPQRWALEQAEEKLRIAVDGAASLQERVANASKAIKIHEDAYADFRHDATEIRNASLRRQSTQAALEALVLAEAKWRSGWTPAVSALGLPETIEPERASEIAAQWATAWGHVEVLNETRTRLRRMDEDEKELRAKIETVAGTLDFDLPDDCLVAGVMLAQKLAAALKIASERQILARQLNEAAAEGDRKQQSCEVAAAKAAALCGEAGCEPSGLEALAERLRRCGALKDRRQALAETVMRSGDGLPIGALRQQWAGRDLDTIKADLSQAEQDAARLTGGMETALGELRDLTRELEEFSASGGINEAVAAREGAIAEIHDVVERYVEIGLAQELLAAAMDTIRAEQQDPLILRASALFATSTNAAFSCIETDIDNDGNPVVVGRRASGERLPVARMSDGVRDQLFLAFRIASIEHYCAAAEPLPFIADDLLVHFDDDRGAAALGLLAELGAATQVLLFTHHRHVKEAAEPLVARHVAAIVDLGNA